MRQTMNGQKKESYESPRTEFVVMELDGVLCMSATMSATGLIGLSTEDVTTEHYAFP